MCNEKLIAQNHNSHEKSLLSTIGQCLIIVLLLCWDYIKYSTASRHSQLLLCIVFIRSKSVYMVARPVVKPVFNSQHLKWIKKVEVVLCFFFFFK